MANQTPQVTFNFQNNNVQSNTPLIGVSQVAARTTKGNFNDPSEVLSTYSRFQEIYGEEIVPDGSVSNILKAFELGSKLRVSRVAGAGTTSKGTAKSYVPSSGAVGAEAQMVVIKLINPADPTDYIHLNMNIETKEYGSSIVDPTGASGKNQNFYLVLNVGDGPTDQVFLSQVKKVGSTGAVSSSDIMNTKLMFSAAIYDSENPSGTPFIEPQVFQDFLNQVPNIEMVFKSATKGSDNTVITTIKNMADVVSAIRARANWWAQILVGTAVLTTTSYMQINEGEDGGESDAETWNNAFDALVDYQEAYNVILSHVHQHLPSTYMTALKHAADTVKSAYEVRLFVEIPKYNADGSIKSAEDIVDTMEQLISSVGQGPLISYFGGGIKYYDQNGALQNCDTLGSILGLANTSEANYGPWYSFAGQNRGVIIGSKGPVMPNLGSSTAIPSLNLLAQWYANVFVVKDTKNQGKQTILQSGFTSNPRNDSERFISIVGLNLYLKKSLRPILESYLEEPNTFSTWKDIYTEAKDDVLDALVTGRAMSSYEWLGDQDATSYDQLVVNNEADVRQGKYKVVLKYRDIPAIQEISIDITIDAVAQSVDIQVS